MQAGAAATLRFIDAEVNYKCLDKAGIVVTTGPNDPDNALDNGAMRLICPNCGAQYEVADDAIPATGRDVQCSNCGHGWFQMPQQPETAARLDPGPEVPTPVLEQAESEPTVPEVPATNTAADEIPAVTAVAAETPVPDATPAPEPVVPPPAQRSSLDDNLLAVLREEAEREVAQRKAETTRGIETQTELGLDAATAAAPPQPLKGAAGSDFSHLSSDADLDVTVPDAPVRPAARRDLLPDVEVISSTLRSSNGAGDDYNPMPDLPPIRRSAGFRSGFLLSVLLAVIIVVGYVLAPRLAEQFPAAKGALDAYVAGIDSLRLWLGSVVASVNSRLES